MATNLTDGKTTIKYLKDVRMRSDKQFASSYIEIGLKKKKNEALTFRGKKKKSRRKKKVSGKWPIKSLDKK